MAQRLVMARHEAVVEDLLDESPPLVRLTIRPWRGPLAEPDDPAEGRLELRIRTGIEEQVTLEYWLEPSDAVATDCENVATAKLGAAWLEGRALAFVAQILDRS